MQFTEGQRVLLNTGTRGTIVKRPSHLTWIGQSEVTDEFVVQKDFASPNHPYARIESVIVNKLHISPGTWVASTSHNGGLDSPVESIGITAWGEHDGKSRSGYNVHDIQPDSNRIQEEIDNAILMADAANTYQEFGMLPSEMMDRIRELEKA